MMRRNRIFTLLAAVFMVLAFSTMALAANNVRLTTTVPNIPLSTCYQAGTDTMEFDHLTAIADGDVIQFTLNNKVTLCKSIDMFVTVNAAGAAALETSASAPIATTAGAVNALGAGSQWGFLVKGSQGSQIVTAQLRVRNSATGALAAADAANVMLFSGIAATDKLIFKLFDGKFGFGTSLIYTPVAGPLYTTALTPITGPTTNVICIDTLTQNYPDEYVQNTPDSLPVALVNKLFFSGDYRIAHIMTQQTISLVTCKGAACGNILMGTSGQNASCTSFDYETKGDGTNGYCSNHKADTGYLPKFVLQSSSAFDPAGNTPYTVKAEILVNGQAGNHGVYWSSTAPAYKTSNVTTCGTAVGAVAFTGQTWYLADGTTAVNPADMVAAGSNNCAAVGAAAKATSFTTTAGVIFAGTDTFFELNLPPFVYNLAEVNAGDLVEVKVTLSKGTCGTTTATLCMGTFIASCPTSAGSSSLLCPFFTSLAAGDAYWNGLALVNTSSSAATVTVKAYKGDGTTATASVSLDPNMVKSQFVSSLGWTGTTPAGVPAYITLDSTAGGLNAFVMMADGANNSMGYLCK